MPYSKVEDEQFEWDGKVLRHKPTGARFWWKYPNSESDAVGLNWSKAGDVLDDGRDFDRDEIMRVAMKFLGEKRKAG